MFSIDIFQHMYTSYHVIIRYIYRNSLYALLVVYGGFGQNRNQLALLDQLQQDMNFVQLNHHTQIGRMLRQDTFEGIAGLQAACRPYTSASLCSRSRPLPPSPRCASNSPSSAPTCSPIPASVRASFISMWTRAERSRM